MKKIILFVTFIALLAVVNTSYAQLSDRVNNPTTFKAGTRPIAGNIGISVGSSVNDIQNIMDDDKEYKTLPIASFKFYKTDKFVITIGVKGSKDKKLAKGEIDPAVDPSTLVLKEFVTTESEFMIVPGFEKHFMSSNILDVYVGLKIPLGTVRDLKENNEEHENGDYNKNSASKRSFAYGLDGIIGLQIFIADLPIALGVELELSSLGYISNKTKVENEVSVGGVSSSQTYYTSDLDPSLSGIYFEKLSARSFETESDLRISLSYFFNK